MKPLLLGYLLGVVPLFVFSTDKVIMVDLSEQKAYAYEDGMLRFSGRISSGKEGRETPTGLFRILEKKRYHRSNLWPKPNGGAKMNYMLRLTNTGIAMHLGYVPNYPASHGCIRMKNGFAQRMFRWAEVGVSVRVYGESGQKGVHMDEDASYGVIDFHD